jgi:hypothetical protein
MSLTPYEFGQEVAQVQIQLRSEISISKATSVARVLEMCEADQVEFLEGYRNRFASQQKPDQLPNKEVAENVSSLVEAELRTRDYYLY